MVVRVHGFVLIVEKPPNCITLHNRASHDNRIVKERLVFVYCAGWSRDAVL